MRDSMSRRGEPTANYRFNTVESDSDRIWELVERFRDRPAFAEVALFRSNEELDETTFIKIEREDKNGAVIDVGITAFGALSGRINKVVMSQLARTGAMSKARMKDGRAFQHGLAEPLSIDKTYAHSTEEDELDHDALRASAFKVVKRLKHGEAAALSRLLRARPQAVFQHSGGDMPLTKQNAFQRYVDELLSDPKLKIFIGKELLRRLFG